MHCDGNLCSVLLLGQSEDLYSVAALECHTPIYLSNNPNYSLRIKWVTFLCVFKAVFLFSTEIDI